VSVPVRGTARPAWERQPGETRRAYEAFRQFRDLRPLRSLRTLTETPNGRRVPTHPAGRIAYAVVGRNDEAFETIGTQLYAVDPDGSDKVLLLDCDVIRPRWSPDGSHLAFTTA
jgi:hypothetical protein